MRRLALLSLTCGAALLAPIARAQSTEPADDEEACPACEELQVKIVELEAKVRRLEARKPPPPPTMRVVEVNEVTVGQQWCHLADLAPGEVLLSGQWLDADAGWTSTEVVGAGFPVSQRGSEVGFRHLAPCGTLALGFRLVIASQ